MTTGPTDVKVTTAAGGPVGMPLALRLSEGLGVSARASKIGKKWRRMAEMYRRFAVDYKAADFSEEAALAMYLHESTGAQLPDPRTNGYALGKKWMDVTVAGWKEEIPQMGLLVSELRADGYPDWFLDRVGVLHLVPTTEACAWWLETPNVRAKRATTAGRQARAGENVRSTTGPGLVACRWRSA